jgi:anti-sigma regulatory factor (Ser/Thr protein kinase)
VSVLNVTELQAESPAQVQPLLQGDLRASIPCTLEGVEEFCHKFRAWHTLHCRAQDLFACELLLREALVNGVAHAQEARGLIVCQLRGDGRRLLISVRDPGPGFDWRSGRRTPKEDCEAGGRGLAIYYRYAQRVRFVEAGNGVTLVRFFSTANQATNAKETKS